MVSFKLFAGTHIGLRENNEDNFTVCPDLTLDEWIVPADSQQAIQLGERGCMLVVADGMGGQNAGEVASAIAVETVHEMFAPGCLPVDILSKPDAIKSYLKKVIIEADNRIKDRTKTDPDTEGMGSTIVMAWVLDKNVYVAWLGDSRAYSYLLGKGIGRMSKDHSYVQQLVDSGVISDDEAMDHPNSNIITRSLGDMSQKPKVDVAMYSLSNGEVILLCSDGLCGVCRDEEIGGIIEGEVDDLQKCKEKLTNVALAAGGTDNITIALLQVFMEGSGNEVIADNSTKRPRMLYNTARMQESSSPKYIRWAVGAALWLLSLFAVFLFSRGEDKEKQEEPPVEKTKGEIVSFKIAKYDSNLKAWPFTLKTKNVSFDDVEFEFDESLFYIDITTKAVIKLKEDAKLEDNVQSYTIKVKLESDSTVVYKDKIENENYVSSGGGQGSDSDGEKGGNPGGGLTINPSGGTSPDTTGVVPNDN